MLMNVIYYAAVLIGRMTGLVHPSISARPSVCLFVPYGLLLTVTRKHENMRASKKQTWCERFARPE